MTERKVVVAGNGNAPWGQTATARGHRLLADEPLEKEGADSGPDPFELVLAGLGACIAMTVRMYARHKGWPLRDVRVEMRHVPSRPGGGEADRIEAVVALDGDLDEAQRARLMDVSERCPVSRMIKRGPRIETRAADAEAAS